MAPDPTADEPTADDRAADGPARVAPTPAEAGAAALRRLFARLGVEPTERDGAWTLLVPIGPDDDERLAVVLTARSAGTVVRIRARRTVGREHLGRMLALCNQWNGRHLTPRATLAVTDGAAADDAGAGGAVVLEAWLPPTVRPADDQVDHFLRGAVAGARAFWRTPQVRELTEPAA